MSAWTCPIYPPIERTVYLVTDERNVLAIDPATYDVWKLYAKFGKQNAQFDWRKLTHSKDMPRRIHADNYRLAAPAIVTINGNASEA